MLLNLKKLFSLTGIVLLIILLTVSGKILYSEISRNENEVNEFHFFRDSRISFINTITADTTETKKPGFRDRREEEEGSDSLKADTSLTESDSLKSMAAASDTTRLDSLIKYDSLARDSSKRLEQFQYRRVDDLTVPVFPRRIYPLFLNQPAGVVIRTVELDSTGQYVLIKEHINEKDVKIRLKLPLAEYIELRLAYSDRKRWEELAYKYEGKLGKKELGDIISSLTNIDIPIPSTPVLSIFGPPRINLRINGQVDIRGAWRTETTEGVTASRLGNTRNEPDFKQDVQINISGTIGDKLNISANWNTQNTFEYENQLKIKYTGYQDEIIQSVEAGNVSLQTSGLVGGGEALFGIKAKMQMGPLTLTGIASQKKGQVKEKSLSGGSEASQFQIRAYQYSKNHFFLDTIYASASLNIFNNYYGNATPIVNNFYSIKDIEVWKTVTGLVNPNERRVNAYIDLPPRSQNQQYNNDYRGQKDIIPGKLETGRFIKLDPADYILHPETGYLTFKTQIQESDVIAVAYRMEGAPGNDNDIFYGEFLKDTKDSVILVLKLIKPANLQPQFNVAWKLQLKNIYPLGTRNLKKDGFSLDILYETPGQEPKNDIDGIKLLPAFGFDTYDDANTVRADGKFDFNPGKTIEPSTGEIIFPVLEPFGKNLPTGLSDSVRYQDIYDTLEVFARQNKAKDRFVISGKSTGDASSRYNLGFNIVENSVKVTLGGRELTPNVDYVMDYNTGQLVIRNESALLPNADLRISYEENDLFQLAAKSLLGLRGELQFSRKTFMGFSILNLNQQTLSDKVRIGEEPLNNTILGIDASTSYDMPFVTDFLNYVINTREMSSINLKGEAAYILPDPNTKKSTIQSDGGRSIAYVDDFEGAKRIIPIGVNYTGWHSCSPPKDSLLFNNMFDSIKIDFKAKTFWFNVLPSNVKVQDIWPKKSSARGEDWITVMDVIYSPRLRSEYNYRPNLSDPQKNWGGIMRILSSSANNLVQENVDYIEFWFKPEKVSQNGKMVIDIGKISEDIIPNGILNTEDKNRNDIIDEGEDTGLDMLTDAQEKSYYQTNIDDPSGDNFSFSLSGADYSMINGTEGNATLTDAGRFPDTEDLNKNGTLDRANSYFSYEFSLNVEKNPSGEFINPYVVGGGGDSKWYQFRIPLKDITAKKVGDPSLTLVETIRMWFKQFDDSVHFRITEFNFVGNQWQKVNPNDSLLKLSVVNIEDNPDYYSPPGVEREIDRSKPDQNIKKNEQSLSLTIDSLKVGESKEIIKFLYRAIDLFNYREMKMFFHGNVNPSSNDLAYFLNDSVYASEIYFRFGADTNNYYEYREPITADWNEIKINFSQITALKQLRDSIGKTVDIPVPGGKPNSYFSIKGNPSLTAISIFLIGVKHSYNKNISYPISGEIWINELRLLEADNSKGWAYSASMSLRLADLINFSANISETSPFFHALEQRFGNRINTRNWGFNVDIDLVKLLPSSMRQSNLKFNYSHTESLSNPLYVPGTDVKIDEASGQLYQRLIKDTVNNYSEAEVKAIVDEFKESAVTISTSDTWSFQGVKLIIPTDIWLINDTWNKLTLSFNYNKTYSRNPTTIKQENWVWNFSTNYAYNFAPDNFIKMSEIPLIGSVFEFFKDVKDFKIYYMPSNISWNFSATRNKGTVISRTDPNRPNISRDFKSTRGLSFGWKFTDGGFINPSINYSLDFASSYAHLETEFQSFYDPVLKKDTLLEVPRSERDIWNSIFKEGIFGKDFGYRQSVDVRTTPRLPGLFDLDKFVNITASYNASYQWNNDFRQEILGRSVSNSSTVSLGLNLRLKQLMDPLFAESSTPDNLPKTPPRQFDPRNRNENPQERGNENNPVSSDSTVVNDSLKSSGNLFNPLLSGLSYLKSFVKVVLFDYENISINYSLNNTAQNSGVEGTGSGITNFWNFFTDNSDLHGPSRLYQLGLSADPGKRARGGNLTDVISQRNNIELRTSRPLWEGARIDINWKVGWNYNKSTSLQTDSLGIPTILNSNSAGNIERSFLTLPPFLFLSVFKNGIKNVNQLYDPNAENQNENLSNAFNQGFETFSLLAKIPLLQKFSAFIPRPNWSLNWDGLEKLPLLNSIATRVSLNHAYTSSISRAWKINPDGNEETQSQRIQYGFQPIIGLMISFKSVWNGNLSANIKFGSTTSYDLGISTKNITENYARDIGISASFSKSGFELPFFGVSLKNDIEISLSYTQTKNSIVVFEMQNFKEEGTPQDGNTRTTLEPRIRYNMSSRVTLSLFYKRSSVEPEGASRIPPTTTNEAGLNINITI